MDNSSNVLGVYSNTLTLRNVPASFSGRRYRLSATDCGTVYSLGAILTVNTSPTVNTHPSDQSTTDGGSVSFSAEFNTAESVRWAYTTDGGSTWNVLSNVGSDPTISGAFTNTLSLSNIPISWAGRAFALKGHNTSCPPTYTDRALLEITNTAPVAICKNITLSVEGDCIGRIEMFEVNNGSYDPDGDPIVSMSLDRNEFDLGIHTVTLTVSDGDLTGQCEAQVTVVDDTPPTASCKDLTVSVDADGKTTIIAQELDDGSIDNCGSLQFEFSDGSTTDDVMCSNMEGSVIAKTLIVKDNNGNQNTCTATVTVEDNIAPVALCRYASVQLDQNGLATLTPEQIDAGSSDACGLDGLSLDVSAFDCDDIGDNTVVLTVTDNNGNQSTCTATVAVEDTENPTIDCPSDITLGNDAGVCGAVATYLISTSDNCEGETWVQTTGLASGSVFPVGTTTNTFVVTDAAGNTSSCSASVTVESPGAESIVWELAPSVKLWPPDYSYQTFTITDMVNNVSDVCGGNNPLNDVWIEEATSDEAEDDPGTQDGNTLNDIVIGDDCRSVQLRKERMGGGNGRVYTLTLAYQNADGEISYANYKAQAPKWAWGWNSDALDDGPIYSTNCGGGGSAAIVSDGRTPSATVPPVGTLQESEVGLDIYPNPFHTETNLKIHLPEAAFTTIEVYNLQGRLIRQIYAGILEKGEHRRQWDGTDAKGVKAPSGLYLIQLRTGDEIINKKLLFQSF